MGPYNAVYEFFVDFYRFSRACMSSHGLFYVLGCCFGFLWVFMGSHGSLCVFMGSYGFL